MSDQAIKQALRHRYRGREGRLVRNRSRELQRAGDRNVGELRGPQGAPAERASIAYELPAAEAGASELSDSYFAVQLGGTIA
jgi:hypothetical protein